MAVVCLRSLKDALISAASTFALFVAANWNMSFLIGNPDVVGLVWRILHHAMFALTMPLLALYLSAWNAFQVRAVKRSLSQRDLVDHDSLAILTLCPIYIKVPQAQDANNFWQSHSFNETTCSELKKLRPANLVPASQVQAAGAARDVAVDLQEYSPDFMYWQLPETTGFMISILRNTNRAQARVALLDSGLAPDYKELCFLRLRSHFQSVVTALQAGANMLNVLQRMLQHLAVSPLEAIMFYLSLLVTLQLLSELYACGNYQRPLLLHLTPEQLSRYRGAFPPTDESSSSTRSLPAVAVLVILFFSIPAVYFVFHIYLHAAPLLSFLSAFLFFLAHFFLIVPAILVFVCILFHNHSDSVFCYMDLGSYHLPLAWVCSMLIYVCSIILGVLSTVKYWHVFQEPAQNLFAWIFPHVSSD